MRIIPSAFKHGLAREEILSALDNPIYQEQRCTDPTQVFLIGTDTTLTPIEIVYTINADGEIVVFHAMPATQASRNRMRRSRGQRRT